MDTKELIMFTANYNQLLGEGFRDFDRAFECIENQINNTANKVLDRVTIPMDIFKEEDGTNIIQIAAVGLKKDNFKITIKSESGVTYLNIKTVVPEKSQDEKDKESKRQYRCKKIKLLSDLDISLTLPETLDYKNTTRTLEDGLLTIRIPAKEEMKPIELNIE